jgi:hypothetical protein
MGAGSPPGRASSLDQRAWLLIPLSNRLRATARFRKRYLNMRRIILRPIPTAWLKLSVVPGPPFRPRKLTGSCTILQPPMIDKSIISGPNALFFSV